MNKIFQLKLASILLFWFGILWESFVIIGYSGEYYRDGTIDKNPVEIIFSHWGLVLANFVFPVFGHFIHIVAGYWFAKGKKKGLVLGISIGLFEIVWFLVPDINSVSYTPYGIAIRILFAFVIYLIISGRKELDSLKLENWRPWKNPKTIPTQ